MKCDNCGIVSPFIKKMQYCVWTVFTHDCCQGNYCLNCRVVVQVCVERYDKMTEFLKSSINNFSLKLSPHLRNDMK